MPGENNHGKKSSVLVHAGDLFDIVKPKTRAYTTVLEALDRLNAAGSRSSRI
jgi:DNA repair exonuclease SbcCD nuclease subunit